MCIMNDDDELVRHNTSILIYVHDNLVLPEYAEHFGGSHVK